MDDSQDKADAGPSAARRGAMFFESDLCTAAETAAFAMECHGLTPEQVQQLGDELGDWIRDFFEKARDTVRHHPR